MRHYHNKFNDQKFEMKSIRPFNVGWVEQKLESDVMKFLWNIIDIGGPSARNTLAGNIHESCLLVDKDDWFFNNVLTNTIEFYANEFGDPMGEIPIEGKLKYSLADIWVNYQKQTEFNPVHYHRGVLSFVVWMKVPTAFEEQRKLHIASDVNSATISNFEIWYKDILGGDVAYRYEMSPHSEGTMLLFPSKLNHAVYPFYNCDEDRVSISGNIMVELDE